MRLSLKKLPWGTLKSFLGQHIQSIVNKDEKLKGKKQDFETKTQDARTEAMEGTELAKFIQNIKKNYQDNLRDNNCEVDFTLPRYEDIFLTMIFQIGLPNHPQKRVPLSQFG